MNQNQKYLLLEFVRKIGLVLTILSPTSMVHSQDFKEALLKMQKEYAAAGRMHIIMSIKAFEKNSAIVPFYNKKAEIKKDDQNYFYQFGDNDMLLNQKYLVMIDHQAKQIVCNKNSMKAMKGFQDPIKMNLDSLITSFGKASYQGKKGDMEHYQIIHRKGAIKQTDMYFVTQTNLIRKIEYRYEGSQFVVIEFELFDRQPHLEANTFDEGRYLSWVNGKMKSSSSHSQYKVIDVEQENQ
jgi:hypothetical protein